MHYINENEDVLVSLDKEIPEGWFTIPHLDKYYLAQTIFNNLFIVSKMYCLAYESFKEPTLAMTHHKWMNANGYHYTLNYWTFDVPTNYNHYDMLHLATLYGGNHRNFNILKPFIVPSEYIQAEYNKDNIDQFIENLKTNGFISINTTP